MNYYEWNEREYLDEEEEKGEWVRDQCCRDDILPYLYLPLDFFVEGSFYKFNLNLI